MKKDETYGKFRHSTDNMSAPAGVVEAMLHHGNKLFALLLCACFIFLTSCKRQIGYNEKEIQAMRERSMEISQVFVGESEYWSMYNQLNDSIRNWRNHRLRWYDVDSTLVQSRVDSLLCVNQQANKMITASLSRRVGKNNVMDGIVHYYGVKIDEQWYFFSGATMHIPREFHQKDIHTPLSFEKLKQIATYNIYRGYLKKNNQGEWEINEGFFSRMIPKNQTAGGYGSCFECETEEEYVLYLVQKNWQQRNTTNEK